MCSLPRTSEWQGAGQAPSCALQETISLGDQQACGMNEQQAMANANKVNAAFSQYAWAAAQQEGCLACPQRLPTWPPEFQYPQDSKVPDEVVGVDPNFGITDTPFYQPPIAVTQPVTVPPPPGAATGYNTALAGVQPTAPSSLGLKGVTLKNWFPLTSQALKGLAYDLKNWKHLQPPAGQTKLGYSMMRDDRMLFIGLTVTFSVVTLAIIIAVIVAASRGHLRGHWGGHEGGWGWHWRGRHHRY